MFHGLNITELGKTSYRKGKYAPDFLPISEENFLVSESRQIILNQYNSLYFLKSNTRRSRIAFGKKMVDTHSIYFKTYPATPLAVWATIWENVSRNIFWGISNRERTICPEGSFQWHADKLFHKHGITYCENCFTVLEGG